MKIIDLSKRIIAFFLVFAVLLSFTDIRVSASSNGNFTIILNSDYLSSLKGIKFDVYRSDREISNNSIEKYINNYMFSVYSDKNGKCVFDKPGSMFVIKADLSTLPRKTGITEDIWTVFDSSSSAKASVNKIKYINIDSSELESGEIKVKLKGKDRKEIISHYTVTVSEAEVAETVNEENGRRTYISKRKIKVNANGMTAEKILTEEKTETATPTVSLVDSEYVNPSFYTEAGAFFKVHYDKRDYTEETAKKIFETFVDAKSYFDSLGFNEPIKDGGKYYNIYLIPSGGASATTKHVKKGSSYIRLLAKNSYTDNEWLYYRSVIAHELFHAIMYTYTRKYDISPEKWFREGFANFAGTAYINRSTGTLKKYVNIFQSNPELSLTNTYDSRVYGATMFPLTIYEYFGGMETIKCIMEQFSKISKTASSPEMTAINKGLAKADKSYSRSKAFVRFALNNMYPSLYYSLADSDKWNDAARSGEMIFADCSLRNLKQDFLTARYYDISPKLSAKSVYITIADNQNKYSDIAFCCSAIDKNGKSVDFSDTIKTFTTFRIKNFSSFNYKQASFGIVNTSISKSQNVSLKITYN